MSSYKWNFYYLVLFAFTVAAWHFTEFNHFDLHRSFRDVPSYYLKGTRPAAINLSDVVYKSALRFLRCSAIPDNPHDIALLDPLEFNWDRLTHRETIRLDGTISGREANLSQLKVTYVNVAVISASAKIQGIIPNIFISGSYNVTGALASVLPVFGFGPFSIDASNISLTVTINIGINQNGSLNLSNFTVEFIPEYIQVSVEGLLGEGPLSALVRDFLQDAILQVVARGRSLIQEDIRTRVQSAANPHLGAMAGPDDLVQFLVSFASVINSC